MALGDRQGSNPYVGPRPFERQDRERFFGRDRECRDIASLIIAHRVLVVYAMSGAGKTSLINAGVIPLLEQKGLQVLLLARVGGVSPIGLDSEQVTNVYILNTLLSLAGKADDERQLAQVTLANFLNGLEHTNDEVGLPALRALIFDQFEELFTFAPERWKERKGFFEQVRDALEADPLLRVVFVIREDFLAQLDSHASELPDRLRTRYYVERLRREQALLAITGPLRGTGRSFAEGVAEQLVEDLLVMRVVAETGETKQAVGEFVEPVQLQVVCQRLWDRLPREVMVITKDHIRDFADVVQTLGDFYEDCIRGVVQIAGTKEAPVRDWVEHSLITPAGTRALVYGGPEQTGGIPDRTLRALEDQHLLRAEWRAGTRWYELTHDGLIDPVRKANDAWRSRRRRLLWKRIIVVGALLVTVATSLFAVRSVQTGREREVTETAQALRMEMTAAAGTRDAEARNTAAWEERTNIAVMRAVQATQTAQSLRQLAEAAEGTLYAQSRSRATYAAAALQTAEVEVAKAALEVGKTWTAMSRLTTVVDETHAAVVNIAMRATLTALADHVAAAQATATAGARPLETPSATWTWANVRIPASADTYIDVWSPNESYGQSPVIVVRQGGIKNGLLRFDLAVLPPGLPIFRAILVMRSVSRSNLAELAMFVGPITRASGEPAQWDENITYETFRQLGFQRGIPSDRILVSGPSEIELNVTGVVKDWQEGRYPNYGFMMDTTGADSPVSVEYSFASSEWLGDALDKPYLEVTYGMAVSPTHTPTPSSPSARIRYVAPVLLAPVSDAVVRCGEGEWKEGVTLRWAWSRSLGTDEVFWIRVWQGSQVEAPEIDEAPIEAPSCLCKRAWWPSKPGIYFWSVVVRDVSGREVSYPSEVWRFTYSCSPLSGPLSTVGSTRTP